MAHAEITVLGIVSITVLISEQTHALESLGAQFGESFSLHLFENIHYAFFVGMLIYILSQVAIMYISVQISTSWRQTQREGKGANV